jgi:hypothetical protein
MVLKDRILARPWIDSSRHCGVMIFGKMAIRLGLRVSLVWVEDIEKLNQVGKEFPFLNKYLIQSFPWNTI